MTFFRDTWVIFSRAMRLSLRQPMWVLIGLAPQWLQVVSDFNPFKHIVEALRAVFRGDLGNPIVAVGMGLAVVLVGLGAWIGQRVLRAQTR